MARNVKQEQIDFCMRTLKEAEPYPKEVYYNMTCFDGDSHIGDDRYAASICLQALLELGFSEDEVNPWKNKRQTQSDTARQAD